MKSARLIDPKRLRSNEGSFAYIPHRFLQAGFYKNCNVHELCIYILLILAANRYGVSFYSREKICLLSGLSLSQIHNAFEGLIQKDLIACKENFTQVLSLPQKPAAIIHTNQCRSSGLVSVAQALHAYTVKLTQDQK